MGDNAEEEGNYNWKEVRDRYRYDGASQDIMETGRDVTRQRIELGYEGLVRIEQET